MSSTVAALQGSLDSSIDAALADGLASINDVIAELQSQVDNIATGEDVDIEQKKTGKKVTVGVIDPLAIEILRYRFPKKLSPQRFNLYLKRVLQAAGINQNVQGYKFSAKTHRKEMGIFPKYEVISSHDLRRSFATNFFGKIPTPVLMQMTGHAKESTFMSYIGRDPNRDSYADTFMEGVTQLFHSEVWSSSHQSIRS